VPISNTDVHLATVRAVVVIVLLSACGDRHPAQLDGSSSDAPTADAATDYHCTNWGTNGVVADQPSGYARAASVDGASIVIVGSLEVGGVAHSGIVRLAPDGTRDAAFANAGIRIDELAPSYDHWNAIASGATGWYVTGETSSIWTSQAIAADGTDRTGLCALRESKDTGDIHPPQLVASGDAGGSVMIVWSTSAPDYQVYVERRGSDCSLDASYGAQGRVTLPLVSNDVAAAILPDGRVVVASGDTLVRIAADGSLDGSSDLPTEFAGTLQGQRLAIDAQGTVTVFREIKQTFPDTMDRSWLLQIVRVAATGALDPTWGTNGVVRIHDDDDDYIGLGQAALLPDGGVIMVGPNQVGGARSPLTLQWFDSSGDIVDRAQSQVSGLNLASVGELSDGRVIVVGNDTMNIVAICFDRPR
jgi:hypothetical protein